MSIERPGIRVVIGANGWLLVLLAAFVLCHAAGPTRGAAQAGAQSDDAVTVLEIKPNFYMIEV